MEGVTCTLGEDRRTLTIAFPRAPGISLRLGANRVEQFIQLLATMRAQMDPGVPDDFPAGQVAPGVQDPKMLAEKDAIGDGTVIHLRHPGLGWLHFGISSRVTRALGTYLLKRADAADVARSQTQMN